MSIKVKGVNNHLNFEINSNLSYNLIMEELKSVLEKLPESMHGYYPKAFFDFKQRKLSEKQVKIFLELLYKSQKVIFGGFYTNQRCSKIKLVERDIGYNELLEFNEDVVLKGDIYQGGMIKNTRNTYIVGKVEGTVVGLLKTSQVNINSAYHAQIIINEVICQNVTISGLCLFYYKDGQILIEK